MSDLESTGSKILNKLSARSLALLSTAALAVGMGFSSGATAAPAKAGAPQILAKDLAGPLSAAAAPDGTRYVTANFGGRLYKVAADGSQSVAFKKKGYEVGAVAASADRVTFAVSGPKHLIKRLLPGGKARTIANVGAYERNNNPDAKRTYGFKGITSSCLKQLPEDIPGKYSGIVESHPYATEIAGGTTYVADAAGNDILSIAPNGKIRTVAVLPPTKVKVTRDAVNALGLPECVKGLSYKFEPVPTDVEMGPDGWLYVSSLPGGPEDGSLGAQGRVYKVNPSTGAVRLVVTGLISAVNVAVAPDGDVYVSQLFAGGIVRIPAGTDQIKAFAPDIAMPAGLEYTATGLVATIDALKGNKAPKGKLALIPFAG